MGIDSVLKDESKSSTYKIALVCSIIDYVIENPSEHPKNGFHYIPLIYIARQFLFYYYPMTWFGPKGIRQGSYPENKNLAIYSTIKTSIKNAEQNNLVLDQPEGIYKIRDLLEISNNLPDWLLAILFGIRTTILMQPLKYIKISSKSAKEFEFRDYEVKGKNFVVFGIYNTNLTGKQNLNPNLILKESKSWKGDLSVNYNWDTLLNGEPCQIKIGHYTYTQLKKHRIFVRDVIIKRWIEFSVDNYLQSDGKAVYALINSYEMYNIYPQRNPSIIKQLRSHVKKVFPQLNCLYCDKVLIKYELDHLIPWSKYPVNFFWNLFPACKICNGIKSDKILSLDQYLEPKIRTYLKMWLEYFKHREVEASKYGGSEYNFAMKDKNTSPAIDYIIDHLKIISEELI